ncbi:MAG: EF-hand domain-containing protein, partial [Phycisphaerales bacterium]|nr:EF-hand domain-containing protein [Phycisphaerales bacterium]
RIHPKHGSSERPADPPQVVAQFDADGDGKINDEERIKAHQAMSRRREQGHRRRAEIREQFDTDEDGLLSPQEHDAMRAWLLEQGLEPPRNGARSRGGPPRRGEHRPPRHGPNRTGETPHTPPVPPPGLGSDPPPPEPLPADG